jgi:hypothetical protein
VHPNPSKMPKCRYRDLLIGIVLNLTCNIENEESTHHMMKEGIVVLLIKILIDSRHDWPTNGAALALLQFAHLGLTNADIF